MEDTVSSGRIDLSKPYWDQGTFLGRLKYFFWVTDCRTVIEPTRKLYEAKELIEQYRKGTEPPGTTPEKLRYARKLYQCAFHPDTGELQNLIGRMSFQVPGGMVICAGMMQFYRTNTAVVFWQLINQSFNALVNYTNRNASSPLSTKQMGIAYVSATSSALVAAIGLKAALLKRASTLAQRFVPFVAVAAANIVNIPLTRQSELTNGVALVDCQGNKITQSKSAAVKGISQVVLSRIVLVGPGMLLMPLLMEKLERRPWFMRYSMLHMPFQTLMMGAFLVFMVPVGCALFPQRSSIDVARIKSLEPEMYKEIEVKFAGQQIPTKLFFNKGL